MKQELPTTLLRFTCYFLKRHWLKFLTLQILWFGWSFEQTIVPMLFGNVIDQITEFAGDKSQAWQVLKHPILLALIVWVILGISFRIAAFILAKALPALEADIRMKMFYYVQHHSANYFSTNYAGTIANKVIDMIEGLSMIVDLTIQLFIPALFAIFIAIIIFFNLNPIFAILMIIWIITHLAVCAFFAKRCAVLSHVHAESRSMLSGKLVDSLTNYLTVKLFANYKFERKCFQDYQNDELGKNIKQFNYIAWLGLVLLALMILIPGVLINGYAYYNWSHNLISVGEVVLIFNATWNVMSMVWCMGIEMPDLFKKFGVCSQALSIIRDPHDLDDQPDATPLEVTHGKIVFKEVSFSYHNKNPIFINTSLTIEPGQKIGLVGHSGGGKSTMLSLILRLFDIGSGLITIDNQDVKMVTQNSLRSAISMIPQQPILFHRSILENIRYGNTTASDAQVFAAADAAFAHDFINELPDGYQTIVGERGVKLSGGQRQRIAIARAILKNAPILFLDEATAALDSITEATIQQSFHRLMSNKTTIVIAHRLSTLLHMDRILVFNKGKIVADGSHGELLTTDSLYKSLWSAQVGGFLPK